MTFSPTKPSNSDQAGFTLLEIAVAITILALGLSTLIALQTRYLAAYETEHNRTLAALYGQYFLTKIEASKEPPKTGSEGGDLYSSLAKEGYFDYQLPSANSEERESMEGWNYQLSVTQQDFPPNDVDALRRVDLIISWGEGAQDQFGLVYYANVPKQTQQKQTGEVGTP